MRFLNPAVLPWLWLAVVPVALYLFRRQRRTVRVSTLIFFKSLAREHQESPSLRRLKRWASLLLSLLLVCGPVVALARLMLAPPDTRARNVVVVVDTSASMAARDANGTTRLEQAKALVRAQLAAVPDGVPVALVSAGGPPEIAHPRGANRRDLMRALNALVVRPAADHGTATWSASTSMAGLETPAEIWWAGDAPPPDGSATPPGVVLRHLLVPLPAPLNAGITAFAVTRRPLTPSGFQVFVQVALNPGADGPRPVVVEPSVDGVPRARRQLTLQPGSTQGLTFDLEAARDQVLKVNLTLPGDVLDTDNTVAVRVPAPRPLVVAWFSAQPDPFTRLALQALASDGEVEVFSGGPSQWPPPQMPDVLIFDGWLPTAWPTGVAALVLNPAASVGPVQVRSLDPPISREEIRPVSEDHPVLYRLNPGRLELMQTSVIDAADALQPLWLAGDQVVLAAGESGGQRVVVLACAPAQSAQLPLSTTYPLLLGNALYWCSEKSSAVRVPEVLAGGALVDGLTAPLEWRELRGGELAPPVVSPAPPTGIAVLNRLGLWRTTDGAREGATALLSRQETDLNARSSTRDDAGAAPETAPAGEPARTTVGWFGSFGWAGGELTRWVIAFVLCALLLESWLYHRHAVH